MMDKFLKISELVLNAILVILYILYIYIVSTMFSIFPWHDDQGLYLIYMLYLWLPLSMITIISLIIRFISKKFDYFYICTAALNAIYIPALFLLGFIDHPFALTAVISIFGCVTMLLYMVKYIKFILKNKILRNR